MKSNELIEGFANCFICISYKLHDDTYGDYRHSTACTFTKYDRNINMFPSVESTKSKMEIEKLLDHLYSILPALRIIIDRDIYLQRVLHSVDTIWRSIFNGLKNAFDKDILNDVSIMFPFLRAHGLGGHPLLSFPLIVNYRTGEQELWVIEPIPTIIDNSRENGTEEAMSFDTLEDYTINCDTLMRTSRFIDSSIYSYPLDNPNADCKHVQIHESYILKKLLEHSFKIELGDDRVKKCVTTQGLVTPTRMKKSSSITITFNSETILMGINQVEFDAYRQKAIKAIVETCIYRSVYFGFMETEQITQSESTSIRIYEQLNRARFLKKIAKPNSVVLPPASIESINSYLQIEQMKNVRNASEIAGTLLGAAYNQIEPP